MKAETSIDVTLDGISIVCKFTHLAKAYLPIVSTPFGIVTACKFVHLAKAYSFITLTLSGIVTAVRSPQPSNALYPTLVIPSSITTSVMRSLRCSQGLSRAKFHPSITLVPLITSFPVAVSKLQTTSLPKLPDVSSAACAEIDSPRQRTRAIVKNISLFFMRTSSFPLIPMSVWQARSAVRQSRDIMIS